MPESLIYRFHHILTKEYACTSGIRNSKKCILSSPNENNVKVGRCLMLEVYACHL